MTDHPQDVAAYISFLELEVARADGVIDDCLFFMDNHEITPPMSAVVWQREHITEEWQER